MSTHDSVRDVPAEDPAAEPTAEPTAVAPRRGGSRRRPRGDQGAPRQRRRDHPVFTPLTGFFTGVLLVVLLGGLLGAILERVVGYDVGAHPWVLLLAVGVLLVVTLGLVALRRTRRFARYMLFGVLTTPAVVAAVVSLTLWVLYRSGR